MAGLGVARLTDITFGVCSCHKYPISVSGVIINGSGKTFAESLNVARIGDIVRASCGHTGIIITGSGIAFADSIGISRLSDITTGCYKASIVSASGTTFSE